MVQEKMLGEAFGVSIKYMKLKHLLVENTLNLLVGCT
jgi:hypothetical protein